MNDRGKSMRTIVKTANRFDSFWTLFLLMPATIFLFNTGMAFYKGQATTSDISQAASGVVQTFSGQYTPYVETVGHALSGSAHKIFKMAAGCSGNSGQPVFINPAMTRSTGCSFGKIAASSTIKPYRSYQ